MRPAQPGVAKYLQVRNSIVQKILDGTFPTRVPIEEELCAMYSVSRTTIRAALSELAREGLINRRPGAGTFVAGPKVSFGLGGLTLAYNGDRNPTVPVVHRVLDLRTVHADPALARLFEVSVGSPLLRATRVGIVGREPTSLEMALIPEEIAQGRVRVEHLKDELFLDIVTKRCGVPVARTELWLSADALNGAEASKLGRRPGTPVIVMRRVSRMPLGKPVLYVESKLAADRFSFFMEFSSGSAKPHTARGAATPGSHRRGRREPQHLSGRRRR